MICADETVNYLLTHEEIINVIIQSSKHSSETESVEEIILMILMDIVFSISYLHFLITQTFVTEQEPFAICKKRF